VPDPSVTQTAASRALQAKSAGFALEGLLRGDSEVRPGGST
jgi:hypothetical protein